MPTSCPIKTSEPPSYSAPSLVVYGGVAKLTAGGTRGNTEQGDPTPDPRKKL